MTEPYPDEYDGPIGNTPPQDNDAEQSVLGSMLLSEQAITAVIESGLKGPDYYQPKNETIHDTILELFTAGEPVDVVTVSDALGRLGALGKVGGPPYIHSLSANVPIPANAGYYADIVRKHAVRRRLIEAADKIRGWATSTEGDVDEILDRAQGEIMSAVPSSTGEDYALVGDDLEPTLDAIEASGENQGLTGVPTGFIDLDELLGGLRGGQMIVVAGRPGMGKSTLGVDFCRAASIRNGMTSAFFSLEMQRQELTTRIIAAEAKVSMTNLRNSTLLSDLDWARIAAAMAEIGGAPLFIDDSPHLTMTEIRAKARRLKRDHDLRLITIDYMQLMTSGRKVENRQVEVSEFSRQIKVLSKELDIPVVALSQLNRGPENRTNKRPMIADLRESGSLEQDADIVILLDRPDMHSAESTRPGEADAIVAKHRNGPTRDVTLAFQGHYSRFVDMAKDGWAS